VLNAANEVAVEAFLAGRLGFTGIPRLIGQTMEAHRPGPVGSLADVREVDRWARARATDAVRAVESRN
jgi:1-deoxy-D-xylulose-5-phosphate reductoisomerase